MATIEESIIQKIAVRSGELKKRFSVESLAVFGSVGKGIAREDSDVDILVRYHKTPGIFGFLELKQYLEDIVGRPVDLVTEGALKKQLRNQILQEAIRVAQKLDVPPDDIIDALNAICEYMENIGYDDWIQDRKTIDAVIRNLEVIGEAAANIPEEIQKQHPDIPWQQMKGMRNVLIHEYFWVDKDVLW